jgi:3-oxoacyl-[acyl-carrier-protein] synthase II
MGTRSRVGIYGWGVVAPNAPDVAEFRKLVGAGRTALATGHSGATGERLFAVGQPSFDFESYRSWIVARAGETRYNQIRDKMGENCLFALGAFVQAVSTAPGLEEALRSLDEACHVCVGSGLGDLPQAYAAYDSYQSARRIWNRHWASAEHCTARRDFEQHGRAPASGTVPPSRPDAFAVDSLERLAALEDWNAYWAGESAQREQFESEYMAIERVEVDSDLKNGPLNAIRARERARRSLLQRTGCPPPPWTRVGSELVFSVQNVPAAQISMLLGTHGPAWAAVGACSTFGLALKAATTALQSGEAKAVVVGTTDSRPDPRVVSSFHGARLVPGTGDVNYPFTSLRGTHVAGGACIWVLANEDEMRARGLEPVGGYVEGVGLSSDADHIITPSTTGPKRAIRTAFRLADVEPDDIAVWDLHATGTPGDGAELGLVEEFLGEGTRITARKGIFGHGMANAGGWELTALALGLNEGLVLPSGLPIEQVHPALRVFAPRLVTSAVPAATPSGAKLMLGVGGINACVILKGKADLAAVGPTARVPDESA